MDGRFSTAVEAIYDAALDPSQWPEALQAMADCFGDVGAILIWQRDDGGFGTIVSPSLIQAQRDYEENEWYRHDLPAQRLVGTSLWVRGDAVCDVDCVSEVEMRTYPFYTGFCATHGLRWRAAIGLVPDPRTTVWLAIQRSGEKPCYSAAELEIATRLGRHAEKSLRLSMRLLDAELSQHGLGEALARIGIGVFALDSLGRVTFANPAGKRLLGPQISIVDGRLLLGGEAERGELKSAVEESLRGELADLASSPKPILLHRPPPDRPLAVYLLPIAARSGPEAQFLTHARALVLVVDPDATEPVDASVVRDVLGVTLGEAKVAALVGSGLPPRKAAEKLGISEETVRSALKRVFSKVGVSRQSELTALLTKIVLR